MLRNAQRPPAHTSRALNAPSVFPHTSLCAAALLFVVMAMSQLIMSKIIGAQICDEKIDLGCAGDCNECCKQPCNRDAATGYDSSSSSLSREDEYVVVPRNLAADFENETKVQLCSGCNAEPDEDGFCDGICFCCYLKHQHQQEEALSSSQEDDAEYDAALHSATACGACGEEASGNLDDGICEECHKVLQTPKKPCCAVWKKLSKETVSKIVVNRCLQGAVSEVDSYAHKKITDSVICVLSKLDTSAREFWQVTTASLLQSLQAYAEDVLPSQYDDDEVEAVFYDLLSLCTSWTPKIVTDWTKVFSDADTGMLIVDHLTQAKPVLVIEKAGLCAVH